MTVQDKLAKFVNEILMEKNLSTYDVERIAHNAGLKITQSYVNRIKIAKAGNVSAPKQKALAVGLGIDPQVIYDIVNEFSHEPTNFTEAVLAAIAGTEHFSEDLQADLLRTLRRLVSAMREENAKAQKENSNFDEKGISLDEFEFIPNKVRKTV